MGKLLPVLLALFGLGAGVGAGLLLKPAPPPAEAPAAEGAQGHEPAAEAASHAPTEAADTAEDEPSEEYVKLSNQFVVPVVAGGRVGALVVLSVSLQVDTGSRDAVFAREPKLRDGFLQVLFDHANAGGFDGVFTSAGNLRTLRTALLEAAQSVMGPTVTDILITDMMRQDG